jgi:hypothetical protein
MAHWIVNNERTVDETKATDPAQCPLRHQADIDRARAIRQRKVTYQSTAALVFFRAATASRSITARHPGLTWARFLCMQAAILEMFGISLPQSLMASPVHICWASDEKARPGDPERPVAEMAIVKVSASC